VELAFKDIKSKAMRKVVIQKVRTASSTAGCWMFCGMFFLAADCQQVTGRRSHRFYLAQKAAVSEEVLESSCQGPFKLSPSKLLITYLAHLHTSVSRLSLPSATLQTL
jgi:hypothetical protein